MKYTFDDVQRFYFTLEKMADGDGRVSLADALVAAFGVDPADFDAALQALGHLPDDRATDALADAISASERRGHSEAAKDRAWRPLRIWKGENGEFSLYDDSGPKTEKNNYGLVAYGFETLAEAEQFNAAFKAGKSPALKQTADEDWGPVVDFDAPFPPRLQ